MSMRLGFEVDAPVIGIPRGFLARRRSYWRLVISFIFFS